MNLKQTLAKEWETVRDLRQLEIRFDPSVCQGTWQCVEVCPIGCWSAEFEARTAAFADPCQCVACGACVLQCKPGAIELIVR
jgi:NAD-dependent dihydropyrimidine dehydrogenase PreA subunit